MKRILILLTFSMLMYSFARSAVYAQAPIDRNHGIVLTDNLRVRSKPSLDGEVVALLSRGTFITIERASDTPSALLANKEPYLWFSISFGDGKTGWVYGGFIGNFYNEIQRTGHFDEPEIFPLRVDGKTENFRVRFYEYSPYDPAQRPTYSDRKVLILVDSLGKPYFIHMDKEKIADAETFPNNDQWLILESHKPGARSKYQNFWILTMKNETSQEIELLIKLGDNDDVNYDSYLILTGTIKRATATLEISKVEVTH